MAEPLGAMFIELGLDVSKFNPRLSSAKNAVKFFQQEVRGLDSVMKGSGQNIGALQAKFKSLQQAIEAQKSVLSSMKKSFDELKPGTAQWEKQAVAIERENAKLAQLEAQLHGVGKAMDELNLKNTWLGKLETKLNESGTKFQTFGDRMQKVGEVFSKTGDFFTKSVTTPILAGTGLVLKAAIDYESAFAGVKKTVNEAVDANGKVTVSYNDLSNGIRKMSKELPASAVQIANVAEVAGQLGIKTEDVLSFSKTMIDLGESTNLSAENAATAIAKIANITGLTSDEYRRFGSSVTALGNNFATTESDIVEMTNRLASAGTLAGLTNQEILGLATAMSSVGIQAEAGGTAMTQTLTAITAAVATGGEDLRKFAKVAGVSSEEFATTWKTKPVKALQGFIKGLGTLKDRGYDATLVLADMQLDGIRQANMLKSLALASDTMTDAVDLSNKAWEENSALTIEANKRYETTESKLRILKNQVTDTAIEFGGPLVDALRDGLEASKPLIQGAADLAKAFSSLDKEQQQNIIKWGAMLVAVGPVNKILGSTFSLVGGVSKGFGGLLKTLGKTAGLLNAAKEIKAVGTAGELATGALGGTTTAIETAGVTAGTTAESMGVLGAVMSSGGAIAIGAIAVAGTVSYFAQKALDAKQRTEEWGASVSQTEAGQLSTFKAKVDETNKAMATFGSDGAHNVDNVKQAFDDLVKSVSDLASEKNSKIDKIAKKLGLSDEAVAEMKKHANDTVDNVKHLSDDVINIYKNANEQHRQLTVEEKAIVENAQNEIINAQLSLMKKGGAERENIQKAINGHIDELNMAQKSKALDTTKKWIEDENKEYQTRKKQLSDLLKSTDESDVRARQELHAKLETLEAEHNARIDAFGKQYIAIRKSMAEESLKSLKPEAQEQYFSVIEQEMKRLGLSYDEFQGALNKAASASSSTSNIIARNTSDMTAKTRDANTYWNALVFDAKTGEVKTNAQEEVNKAVSAEGGWEAIKFAVKEANLTSNARIMIGEALVQSGQWNSLSIQDKELLVHGQKGLQAIFESKRNLDIWNSLEPNLKELLGNNENFLGSAEVATRFLEKWNLMTPTEKALYAKDLTSGDVTKAQKTINGLLGKTVGLDAKDETILGRATAQASIDSLTGKTVDLNADPTKAQAGTGQGKAALDSYNSHPMTTKQLPSDATPAINATNQGKSALNSYNGYPIDTRQLPANSSPAVSASNQGKSALNSYNSHPISTRQLNAQDNASSVAAAAKRSIDSIPSHKTSIIDVIHNFFTRKHEKGTDYHQGGLAMVNDQKGSNYKELITLPTGEQFIPNGRNVVLPLPVGSKVLNATKTRQLMQNLGIPKYQNGVGIPSDAKFLKELDRVQSQITIKGDNKGIDTDKLVNEISDMKSVMATLLKALLDKDSSVYLDGKAIAENTYKQQARIMAREGI